MAMLEQQQPFDLSFTIAIVGDASTGKSTLVHQETTSFFSQGGAAYVERGISEVSIEDKIYRVNDSRCLVHFVDVPGADRFARLSCRFAAGACAIAYVFDVTSSASFDHIEEWMARTNPTKRKLCAQLLIGNKCDQAASDRQVSVETAVAFARRHDMIFCATSAITGEGVSDAFATLIGQVAAVLPTPLEPAQLLDKRIRINVRRSLADQGGSGSGGSGLVSPPPQ